jgi:phosphoglycolate phosphatase-like HAD superfamily hydrolase
VRPVEEGSEVILGAALADIASAMNAGLTAADVVMPKTRPEQIGLFATEGL